MHRVPIKCTASRSKKTREPVTIIGILRGKTTAQPRLGMSPVWRKHPAVCSDTLRRKPLLHLEQQLQLQPQTMAFKGRRLQPLLDSGNPQMKRYFLAFGLSLVLAGFSQTAAAGWGSRGGSSGGYVVSHGSSGGRYGSSGGSYGSSGGSYGSSGGSRGSGGLLARLRARHHARHHASSGGSSGGSSGYVRSYSSHGSSGGSSGGSWGGSRGGHHYSRR